jgi:hypothetical protein
MSILLCMRIWKGMMPSWNNIVKLISNIFVLGLFEISSKGFSELFCNLPPSAINTTVVYVFLLFSLDKKIWNQFYMKNWLDNRIKVAKIRLVFEPNFSIFYFNLWYLLRIFEAIRYVNTRFFVILILFRTSLATAKRFSF